ncbi:hypothetical protein B296_00030543, partial [Ensete ventricosum]
SDLYAYTGFCRFSCRSNYFIPPKYELHAPLLRERPYDTFPSGFSLSTDALEAGLRGVKDMNKAWLAEAGLSPPPWGSIGNRSASVVAIGSTAEKGASVDEGSSLRKLLRSGASQVWIEGPLSGEYLWGAVHPVLAKQVYECSSKELMNKAGKSAIWLVRSQHERILALRATNKELKHSAIQDLVVAVELHAKELEEDINKAWAELESLKDRRRELE